MRKNYLLLGRFLSLSSLLCSIATLPTSCVNDQYSLDKELDLNTSLGGSLTLPLGKIDTLMLGDMIDTDNIDMLEMLDGGYRFSLEAEKPIEVSIDAIADKNSVSIPAITPENPIVVETDFATPEVGEFGFDLEPQHIDIDLSSISPVTLSGGTDIDYNMSIAAGSTSIPGGLAGMDVSATNIPLTAEDKAIDLNMGDDVECTGEVKSIKNIEIGSTATVELDVTSLYVQFTPETFELTLPTFTLNFPEGFVLSCTGDQNAADNIIELTNLRNNGNKIEFSFTIDEYDKPITANASGYLPISQVGGEVTCDLPDHLTISGTTSGTGSSGDPLTLNIASSIQISDMTLEVADIEIVVDDNETLSEETTIDLPNLIKELTSVTLDPAKRTIDLSISAIDLPTGLTAGGDDIQIIFPATEKFVLNEDANVVLYSDGITVNGTSYAEYYAVNIPISDVVDGAGYNATIEIEKIYFDEDIVVSDDENVSNYIPFNPNITMRGTTISVGGDIALSSFNEFVDENDPAYDDFRRTLNVEVTADELAVESAAVVANEYVASLDEEVDGVMQPRVFDIDINETMPDELARIDSMKFKDPVYLNIDIDVTLSGTDADLSFSDYEIHFPKFLTFAEDVAVNEDNVLILNDTFEVTSTGRHFSGSFEVTKIDFTSEEYADIINENKELTLNEQVKLTGAIKMSSAAIDTGSLGSSITASVDYEISEMDIAKVYGIVKPEIPADEQNISLLEFASSMTGDLSIVLTNPTITITASNTLAIPVKISQLDLVSYLCDEVDIDGDGDVDDDDMTGSDVADREELNNAHLADADGVIIPAAEEGETTQVEICIYDEEAPISKENGITYVAMKNLRKILEQTPNLITLAYEASTAEIDGENHMIDLYEPYSFVIDYSLDVPLEFETLTFDYADTVKDLGKDLEEVLDYITALELELDVKNTLPIGLTITELTPLDADGEAIEGLGSIIMEENSIPALTDSAKLKAKLADNENGDIRRLDGLQIGISAAADSSNGGAELRADQYLIIGVTVRIPDGINVDFNEM